MRCHQCGHENAAGASQCARCAAILEPPGTPWAASDDDEITADPAPSGGPARNLTSTTPKDPRKAPTVSPPGSPSRRRVAPPIDPKKKLIGTGDLPAFPSSRVDPLSTAIDPLSPGKNRDQTSPWADQKARAAAAAELRSPAFRKESETEQIPIDSLLEKVRGGEQPRAPRAPWDEAIAKAPASTLHKYGTTPAAEAETVPRVSKPEVMPPSRATPKPMPPPSSRAAPPAERFNTEATETSLPKWSVPQSDHGTAQVRPLRPPDAASAATLEDKAPRSKSIDDALRARAQELSSRDKPTTPARAVKLEPTASRKAPEAPSVSQELNRSRPPEDASRSRTEPTGARARMEDLPRRPEPTAGRAKVDEPAKRAEPTGARAKVDDLARARPLEAPSTSNRPSEPPPRKVSLPPFTPRNPTADRSPARASEPVRASGFPEATAPAKAFGPDPQALRQRPPAADTLPPLPKLATGSKAPPLPSKPPAKLPVPPQETAAMPWELANISSDLPQPELKNAPVILPPKPNILTADLDLPQQKPSDASAPSGTVIGLLSPIDPPSGAGELTRVAPEGAMAGPPPILTPAKAKAESDAPGFSHAPNFDDPSIDEPWGLHEPPKEAKRQPLDETRAYEAVPAPQLLAFGANERTAPLPAQGEAIELKLQIAGGVRRVGAAIIDLCLIILALQGLAFSGLLGEAWTGRLPVHPDLIAAAVAKSGAIAPVAAIAALLLVGSIAGVASIGRSPGKLAFGIRVVTRKTGKKPGILRATLRGFLSLISFAFAGVGYWWWLIDRERRTLHDVATGTTTVRSRAIQ